MPNPKKKKLASDYLETDKPHKDWFDSEVGMGKQRGKPHAVPPNVRKKKGEFRARHRKQKLA